MTIKSIAETSYSGMYKVSVEEGPAFYIRKEYLQDIDFDSIETDAVFENEEEDKILDAGMACVVELKAVNYLARSEQSRFGLSRKLYEKQYEKKYINMALDLLESKKYLSDERYSRAWLNTRKINHYEGRTKLLAELTSRGIEKSVAQSAVEEFFSENDESEICLKAFEKLKSKGKTGQKLLQALFQAGFSSRLLRELEIFNKID